MSVSMRCWFTMALGICLLRSQVATSQDEGQDDKPSPIAQLSIQQGIVADKYARLEKLLEDMARIEAVSNPRRAGLLLQAMRQSKDKLTSVKLNSCVQLLGQEQLSRALENQRDAHTDMKALLELLLSENRPDRLRREQDRIKEYIKEVERILRLQKSVQGRTEGGADAAEVSKDQGKIADRTGDLAEQIQQNEEGGGSQQGEGQQGEGKEGEGKEGEGKQGEGKQGEGKQGEGKQGEGKEGEGKEGEGKEGEGKEGEGKEGEGKEGEGKEGEGKEGEGKEGEGKEGEGKEGEGKEGEGKEGEGKEGEGKEGEGKEGEGKEGEGQQGEGQQGEGQQGEGQQGEGQQGEGQQGEGQQGEGQQQEANPARQRIQAAEERMREAQQRLEEAKRKDAVAEQEQAKEELEKAKAELERILRQMREEELERMLALLEGRFRRMLELQLRIYEDTCRLDRVPEDERDLKVPIPAARLATDERKLVIDADKALNLLLEEGSSIAFPETVSQMRDDMQQVSERLDGARVSRITQAIEEDIIAALEEMIEALQKAQQDLEEQQQQQQQQQPMQPGDMPLVDQLAELKMIRSLQMRVNTRTQRYARLLDDIDDPTGQAQDGDLVDALTKLSERQNSIYRITRDIVLGKNQ